MSLYRKVVMLSLYDIITNSVGTALSEEHDSLLSDERGPSKRVESLFFIAELYINKDAAKMPK